MRRAGRYQLQSASGGGDLLKNTPKKFSIASQEAVGEADSRKSPGKSGASFAQPSVTVQRSTSGR